MTDREVDLACLASLPSATPHRLRRLLAFHQPADAWRIVRSGRVPADVAPSKVRRAWTSAAGATDRGHFERVIADHGIGITCIHDSGHPAPLVADIDPAPIIFSVGRNPSQDLPRVAVIGTRRCTPVGRGIATEIGEGLSAAGVVVVSGLALGIDGAAHEGALNEGATPPVAVVGGGPDVVYPRRHLHLWKRLADRGVIFTEAGIGARPEPWRFPARNRLIAAMSDLVVVIESRAAGGSMLTVEQAIRRGVPVMAVPGSIRNQAADGTNQLIADGCQPVRDVDDILMALGLASADTAERHARRPNSDVMGQSGEIPPHDDSAVCSADNPDVFGCIDDGPTTLDEIADRCSAPIPVLLAELDSLIACGLVKRDGARFLRSDSGERRNNRQESLDVL